MGRHACSGWLRSFGCEGRRECVRWYSTIRGDADDPEGVLTEVGFEVQEAASVRDAIAVLGQGPDSTSPLIDWTS